MQFSFTLVNLLDPNSNIETPVFSQMFQLLTTTILVSSGFDRIMISATIKTYTSVLIGRGAMHGSSSIAIIQLLSMILSAAVQLIAPLIAATVLVEVSIALLSRLSPQLPVLALTVPAKTIVGFAVITLTLGSWTLFIEREFSLLLDFAECKVMEVFRA
jgi:flagellar biosynthetic protein FliR